jgi:hypothetical protein
MFDKRGITMTAWTGNELTKIGRAEELQIASLRNDGTLRSMRIIWVVRIGDDLYVRSVKGRTSDWFRGVQTRHEGHIRSGGVEKNVMFVDETDPKVNEKIDTAYQEKYRRYPKEYVDACLTVEARAASIKLEPK